MDYLDKWRREKEEGKDDWSNVMLSTKFRASDGLLFENFDDALDYDKTINVRARHRGAIPDKIITYTCTDWKQFVAADGIGAAEISAARKHQEHLKILLLEKEYENLAEILYGDGISSIEDLRESLMVNRNELDRFFRKWCHATA